jgi:excisionase family DNA binding protein
MRSTEKLAVWYRFSRREFRMKRKDGAKTPPHTRPAKVMTIREVSAYLHVHPSTIYRLLKQNQIPAFHIGSDWRFNIEEIDRWRFQQSGKRGH